MPRRRAAWLARSSSAGIGFPRVGETQLSEEGAQLSFERQDDREVAGLDEAISPVLKVRQEFEGLVELVADLARSCRHRTSAAIGPGPIPR